MCIIIVDYSLLFIGPGLSGGELLLKSSSYVYVERNRERESERVSEKKRGYYK
jgi:hypothetical protein